MSKTCIRRASRALIRMRVVGTLVLLVVTAACDRPDGSAQPLQPESSLPTVPTVPSLNAERAFRVAALLGAAQAPSSEDVHRVLSRASDVLYQKTGERMTLTDLTVAGPGSAYSQGIAYVNAHTTAPPDGVLNFSDDETATTYGGYSQTFSLPPPHENRFPSPVLPPQTGYLAVVHFAFMYARCGYDDAGKRIGSRSSGGECLNRSGLTCVDNGRYWMCPDTVNDLYADPDYFTACSVVHEFLHPFGSEGASDHYGTVRCTARTGMSQTDARNAILFQQSCGICPDVYRGFRHR